MKFLLTRGEYEKKIFEKFSKLYAKTKEDELKNKEILQSFLNDEGKNYMNTTFKETKDRYLRNKDNWKKLGFSESEVVDKLIFYPVNTLEMLLL